MTELEGLLEGTGTETDGDGTIEADETAGIDELGSPVLQGTDGAEEDL